MGRTFRRLQAAKGERMHLDAAIPGLILIVTLKVSFKEPSLHQMGFPVEV